ncbi:hypothetical protein [Pendulispora albinea]|uniref:Uncharacterized protein n=1 Tax=Pendulispora albinea TaxID=2741071 RepID=A0ABZ2LTE0_9BACT
MRPFLAMAIVAFHGCDRQERIPPQTHATETDRPATPEQLARALGKDAAALLPPADPAPAAGDLKADLEHFTTVDACVAERAAIDPVVGDALLAVGYDMLVRDACRVLEATKAKDPKRCSGIDASALRARCEASVAMATSNPDGCPFDIPGDPSRGRDPTCIAVASRDARLCAGEADAKRRACEAMASGDPARCGGDAARNVCARDATRWKAMLAPSLAGSRSRESVSTAKWGAPSGVLSLKGAEGTPDPPQSATDLAMEVERGVVLVRELGSMRVRVGVLQELGAIPRVASPVGRPRIGFELRVTADAPSEAKIERLELEVPGALTMIVPGARSTLRAQVHKLGKGRGGEVRIVLEGTVGSASGAYAVRVELDTFVRDKVGR